MTTPKNQTKKTLRDGYRCFDCRRVAPFYMVRHDVWEEAFPTYREEKQRLREQYPPPLRSPEEWRQHYIALCLGCLQGRLGRSLELHDFLNNVDFPLLELVYKIGRRDEAAALAERKG